jgi:periplasmic protein TonB
LPETAAPAASSFTVPTPPEVASTAPDAKIVAAPVVAPPGPPKEVPVTPPIFNAAYLGNPPLRYPVMARKAGIEGTVVVRVLVSKEGRPLNVALEKSSGSSVLDNAAIDLAKAYKFVPARRGQEPVEQSVSMPFVYKLEGG